MATVNPIQSQEQKNFQNQMSSLQGGQISNPQVAKVNNLVQEKNNPLNTSFKTDKTIGGNNFYIPNGGQGQQNALVNTGAVAGIKEQNLPTLNQPQGEEKQIQKGQVLKAKDRFKKNGVEYYCPAPTPENPNPQPVPVNTTPTPTKKTTPQPQPQQEINHDDEFARVPEQQEEINHDDEFAKNPEQPQEQIQEEERENPEMNIEGDNKEGVIYGRASGNNDTRIETNADPYSAEAMAMQGRQQNYTNLQGMNSMDIATSIVNGFDPYGSQAMRDLQQYDPQKYEEIQSYIKQLNGEQQVNNITNGGTVNLTDSLKKQADTINNGIDDRAKKNSDGPSYNSTKDMLTDKLASSQTAQTATQEMININTQIADIQERMQNLPNEAKEVFKGDVPQYLVDAYVSNNMQRLQSELGTLQNRYSGLIDMYKTEVAQKQWETEMELKNRQFQADQLRKQYDYNLQNQKLAFDQQKRGQQYALDLQQFQLGTIKTDSNGRPYQINGDGTMTYIQDTTAQMLINQQRQNAVNSLLSTKPDGAWGGQCEAFTNRYLESTYGTRFQGVNGYTTAEEKAGYINTDEPVIGSIAIFNYDKNSGVSEDAKKYGHTMVVTGYDPSTGTITLKGSNKSNKAGEKEMVYTSTYNIKNLKTGSLKGFYDPMLDKSLDDQVIAGDNSTGYNVTEMTPVRDKLFQSASTEGKSDTIATAESIYTSLKKIRDDGSLYDLITSGAMGKIIGQLQGKKFVSDDDGGMFVQELTKIIGNTDLGLSEKSKIALLELRGLVEQKLRKETGAAIASSEWLSNFAQLVPEANESEDVQMSKLKKWDDIIFKYARKGGMASDEYIPLFQGDLPTGLESELEAIINDNRTGTGGKRFDPSYRF